MRSYTVVYDPNKGYCAWVRGNGFKYRVSFWYKSLARLNRYWGFQNGIRFKSVKGVVYK